MTESHAQLLRRPSVIDEHLANLLQTVSIEVEVSKLFYFKTMLNDRIPYDFTHILTIFMNFSFVP